MGELWRLAPFRNAYLLRGIAVWLGVRLAAAFAGIGDPNLVQEAFILAVVGGLVLWDARRRDEDLFLANLGVRQWPVAALGVLGCLPLEGLVP